MRRKKSTKEDNVSDEFQRRKGRFVRNLVRSAETALVQLEADPHLPQGMHYFINIMRNALVNDHAPYESPPGHQSWNNKKVIGIYCLMAPEEFIYAAGAIPVRLCGGSYEAALAGDEFVPRDICPVVRASIGFTAFDLLPIYQRCDAVIVPTTCDGKRKLGEVLSDFTEVWMLEVPHIKETERSRMEWLEQIYALKKGIEKLTHKKIKRKALRDSIQKIAQAQYQARKLYEIKRLSPPVIGGRHAMLATNAYAYDTVDEWTGAMAELNEELEDRRRKGEFIASEQTPRIMLAASPTIFPNWKIPTLVEEMGGVIVTDETCMGDRYLYDPVGVSETSMTEMMRAIAARLIMPCICPSFSPNEDRVYRLLQMIEEFRIDGIIYHVLKGCLIYDFELIRIEKIMKEKDIPVLRVETDYNPEDVEQLRTRIEAFIEMIRAKKKRKV